MTGAPAGGAVPAGAGRERIVRHVRAVLADALQEADRAVIALSGGPDSVSLASVVAAARPDLVLHAAHVRHGLRDDREDVRCARECAAALGVPFHELAVRVDGPGGPEAAARAARYDALADVVAQVGARAVLVGHTADDQAETVLLNLARGSGLAGLAGMTVDRTDARGLRVLRPLLAVRRADVRALAAAAGLAWTEDPTNADPHQRRSRARHETLPALGRLAGGAADATPAVARLAAHARRDDHALQVLAEREFGRVGRRWGPVLAVPAPRLSAMPEGLALRVLRVMVSQLDAPVPASRQLEGILALRPGQALHIRGLRVSCGGGWLAGAPDDVPPLSPRPVVVPGATALPELGLQLCADHRREPVDPHGVVSPPPGAPFPAHARLPVPADAVLALRARRPGDRMPLREGSRSLQDLFTDAGVPRLARDLLPVVVDAADQPIWVPGVAVARVPESLAHVRAWLAPSGAPAAR